MRPGTGTLWKEEKSKTECDAEGQSDLDGEKTGTALLCRFLNRAIRTPKLGKSSSDGITTEVLRELDESNFDSLDGSPEPSLLAQHISSILERDYCHIDFQTGSRDPTQRFQTHYCIGHSPKVGGILVLAPHPRTFLAHTSTRFLSLVETHPQQCELEKSGNDHCTSRSWTCRRPLTRSATKQSWKFGQKLFISWVTACASDLPQQSNVQATSSEPSRSTWQERETEK